MTRQCALIGLSRSSYYHEPVGTESNENLRLMRKTVVPTFGVADPLSLPNLAKWSQCMAAHPVAGPFFAEYDAAVDAFLKMLRGG